MTLRHSSSKSCLVAFVPRYSIHFAHRDLLKAIGRVVEHWQADLSLPVPD